MIIAMEEMRMLISLWPKVNQGTMKSKPKGDDIPH